MNWKECYLCLRVNPKRILDVSHKLFPFSAETAHRIGMKAAEVLRKAYFKNPVALCGRSTKGLIGGALYVACLLEGERVTQREIADDVFEWKITESTVRNSYRRLIKILELEDELLTKREPGWGVKPYYYPKIPRGIESAKATSDEAH